MKEIGKIQSLKSFVDWCESKRELLQTDPYKSSVQRKLLPIGYEGTLDNPPQYFQAHWDDRMDALAKRFTPNWKLALLCLYGKGGGIKLHRDSTAYGNVATAVSSTAYIFQHDNNRYECKAGHIYQFNSKLPHAVEPLAEERWALIWWEPNWPYWQGKQLSLF